MLMKCTECGHDVSEFADRCPNCRCPIDIILKSTNSDEKFIEDSSEAVFCNINGKKTDIKWLKDIIEGLSETELYHYKYVWSHDMGSPKEQMKCQSEYSGTPEYAFYRAARKLYEEVSDKCDLTYMTSPRLLYGLVESDFELKEFYGESETEAVEKIDKDLHRWLNVHIVALSVLKKQPFGRTLALWKLLVKTGNAKAVEAIFNFLSAFSSRRAVCG